jgi:hypothetical protein
MKRSNSKIDNRETNKTMVGEELLKQTRQGLSSERKTFKNPKSQLSQVEMFLPTFFPNWASRMMLYG